MSVSRMDIQLDRPDPLYYAGEVVRGTVAIETTGNMKCRGFHIRLQARARVLWIDEGTAQGSNLREGSTLLQSQQQTFVGNYYKTALLDEAGPMRTLILYQIVGSCGFRDFEKHDNKKFKVIVRVMDYDRELGNDLLGEVLLKVSPLVQARDSDIQVDPSRAAQTRTNHSIGQVATF